MGNGVQNNDGGINRQALPSAGVKGAVVRTTPTEVDSAIDGSKPGNSFGVLRSNTSGTYPGDSLGNYPATSKIIDQAVKVFKPTPAPQAAQGQFDSLRKPIMTDENGDPIMKYAKQTVDWERRNDKDGNIAVYKLGKSDGGGTYEVAGINEKYDPDMVKKLVAMAPAERAPAATQYIADQQRKFALNFPEKMHGFALDMGFNRGAGGATTYIQEGLNKLGQPVTVDGALGPKTLAAVNSVDPKALMRAASDAQWEDELKRAQGDPGRLTYLDGLKNRIENRFNTYSS